MNTPVITKEWTAAALASHLASPMLRRSSGSPQVASLAPNKGPSMKPALSHLRSVMFGTALAALSWSLQAAGVPGQGTWETTLQARDLNGDSFADAFYDTSLNITWLANWDVNGTMTAGAVRAWAEGLEV